MDTYKQSLYIPMLMTITSTTTDAAERQRPDTHSDMNSGTLDSNFPDNWNCIHSDN